MAKAERDWDNLALQVSTVFTPAIPVSESTLFAGRMEQIRRVVDAINQKGQHAIIYGERGVGKTSLANILSTRVVAHGSETLAPRVNCDGTDDFGSLWKKVLSQVVMIQKRKAVGFRNSQLQEAVTASETIGESVTPDAVRGVLELMAEEKLLIVIVFDEFDRLCDPNARRFMADTIKALSDHAVRATIVIVGVADTVSELIDEHRSIERALIQVHMPRMSSLEIQEILDKGTAKLGMSVTQEAKAYTGKLSQGLPHYAHLLSLHASRIAIDDHRLEISIEDIKGAVRKAVTDTQQSLRDDYREAVSSPQADNLYGRVLLACALAKADEFGYFAAGDVRHPLSKIMNKKYEIPSFAKHLNDFCQTHRGAVLKKSGVKHKFRYRFTSPLMQPLVIMKGIIDGHVKGADL
jgi:Cdc6-like AAA superfamily ATPase